MIRSVEMQGLRGIRQGRLDDLTPLSVIVGPNGSGKSTVLDALLIGASRVPGEAIVEVVSRRRSIKRPARWLVWRGIEGGTAEIAVQSDKDASRNVELTLDPNPPRGRLSIECRISWSDAKHPSNTTQFKMAFSMDNDEVLGTDNGSMDFDGVTDVRILETEPSHSRLPLHQLLTKVVEQGRRGEARDLLASVVPGVRNIEILTEGDTPVVYLDFSDHSVPAALAGDGVQSLLRLTLELAGRSGGVVLMEEPEVHQHPGAIRQTAKAIWAAVHRQIQIVVTTHSLDLIDALLAESGDEESLNQLSVFHVALDDGVLRSNRVSGPDVAFARTEIGDDLR